MSSTENEITELNSDADLKQRDRYLLERDRIKNQIGDLDQILLSLGVNQRRACQLLLVDPSAWTRWNKSEAPPHIYQALKWLLMLKKTNPGLVGTTDIETRIDLVQSATQTKIKELERNVASLERALTYQSINSGTGVDGAAVTALFRAQEEKLQKRIADLEEQIQNLSQKKPMLSMKSAKKVASKRAISKKKLRKTKSKKTDNLKKNKKSKTAKTRKAAGKKAFSRKAKVRNKKNRRY